MGKGLTLRDKLAISMPDDAITIPDLEVVKEVFEKYGLEWSDDDPIVQIRTRLLFTAIMRYEYADAMLACR